MVPPEVGSERIGIVRSWEQPARRRPQGPAGRPVGPADGTRRPGQSLVLDPPAQLRLVLMEQCLDGDPVHPGLLGLDVPRTVRSRRRRHIRAHHGSSTDPRPHPIGAVPVSDLLTDAGVSAREAEVLALVGAHLTQRRDRRAPVHLGADGREPRLLAPPQARGRRPPGPGRGGREADPHGAGGGRGRRPRPVLPSPLTSFVGRARRARRAGRGAGRAPVRHGGRSRRRGQDPPGAGRGRRRGGALRRRRLVRRPGAGDRPGDGRRRGGGGLRVRRAAGPLTVGDGDGQAGRSRGAASCSTTASTSSTG